MERETIQMEDRLKLLNDEKLRIEDSLKLLNDDKQRLLDRLKHLIDAKQRIEIGLKLVNEELQREKIRIKQQKDELDEIIQIFETCHNKIYIVTSEPSDPNSAKVPVPKLTLQKIGGKWTCTPVNEVI